MAKFLNQTLAAAGPQDSKAIEWPAETAFVFRVGKSSDAASKLPDTPETGGSPDRVKFTMEQPQSSRSLE